jgi:hypothetical protein
MLSPSIAPTQQAPDAEYYRDILHQVIEINVNLARVLDQKAQAHATPDAPPLRDLIAVANAVNDTARTIRRCILVGLEVAKPIAATPDPAQRRVAARQQIIRQVEDQIHRQAADEHEAETLNAELQERLDRPDLDDAIDDRPIPEIIAELVRDFGLEATANADPWKRRTPGDIAQLHARAAAPPAPIAMPGVQALWPGAPRFRGGP